MIYSASHLSGDARPIPANQVSVPGLAERAKPGILKGKRRQGRTDCFAKVCNMRRGACRFLLARRMAGKRPVASALSPRVINDKRYQYSRLTGPHLRQAVSMGEMPGAPFGAGTRRVCGVGRQCVSQKTPNTRTRLGSRWKPGTSSFAVD